MVWHPRLAAEVLVFGFVVKVPLLPFPALERVVGKTLSFGDGKVNHAVM